MTDSPTLDTLISVSPRFARSVSLARDAGRADALDGYIFTPTGRDVLRRLAEAMRGESPTRAWSLTGPYGSGKSAFALFAAQLLAGEEEVRSHAQVPRRRRYRTVRTPVRCRRVTAQENRPALPGAGDGLSSSSGFTALERPIPSTTSSISSRRVPKQEHSHIASAAASLIASSVAKPISRTCTVRYWRQSVSTKSGMWSVGSSPQTRWGT